MLNMLKIVTSRGTPDKAPSFMTGFIGLPAWSGKTIAELSDSDVREMCAYADEEGERTGWLDALENKDIVAAEAESNPFHEDFLGAVPFQLWRMAYRHGARGATATARRPAFGGGLCCA